MADLKDLAELTGEGGEAAEASAPEAKEETAPREPKIDELGRAYGTGRRKRSCARVWIKRGKGKVVVNGKDQETYFGRKTHLLILNQPFLVSDRVGQYDVYCTVKGGGLSGQAGAVRHGISRALENFEPELRSTLKTSGMLKRDSRRVEPKKIGKHKARRSKQWAKR